ncbi:hypothetical protein KGQ34_01370 [Patescibacteria group bacterium]|nr:hypothetical protein [Patescibacteria group bacterium]
MANERQKAILQAVIDEFIESAAPVASSRIVHKYHFPYSSATVRNDFLKLDAEGYLEQPHTSAGRVPTDKGYRFYADAIFDSGKRHARKQKMLAELARASEFEEEEFIRTASRMIAGLSHGVACAGFPKEELFYKSGFAEALDEPEFDNSTTRKNFAELVDDIDNFLAEMVDDESFSFPRIFIGNENPIELAREYSVMISSFATPFHKEAVIGIIGPKRMDYQKNMLLLQELQTLW